MRPTCARLAPSHPPTRPRLPGYDSNSKDDSEEDELDPLEVFDLPEAEPDQLFVDPFSVYGVSPMQVGWVRVGMGCGRED